MLTYHSLLECQVKGAHTPRKQIVRTNSEPIVNKPLRQKSNPVTNYSLFTLVRSLFTDYVLDALHYCRIEYSLLVQGSPTSRLVNRIVRSNSERIVTKVPTKANNSARLSPTSPKHLKTSQKVSKVIAK